MEDKMKYNKDILDVLQDHANKIVTDYWKDDDCTPVFRVSIINEDMNNQKILLTITHLGSSFTYTLFPRTNSYYGYESLENMMINMYNQTM